MLIMLNSISAMDISSNSSSSDLKINSITSDSNVLRESDLTIMGVSYNDTIANSNDYSLQINVKDSYNNYLRKYSEEGYNISNASVKVFDSSNNLVYSGLTDNNGNLYINNLYKDTFTVKINYLTYKEFSRDVTFQSKGSIFLNHMFTPDIILFMYYSGHSKKIDILTNLSRRVACVDSYPYNKELEWLFYYANYVHLDMYTNTGTYSFDTTVLKDSPAFANYNIAYTFGVYTESIIKEMDLHYVGGNLENNTPNSIENTYIGSYFQAENIPDLNVVNENMKNYLAYVEYLIEPEKYINPTLDPKRTPLVAASSGLYHPDFGTLTSTPSQVDINNWIKSNPGYNSDGYGSLNWMTKEYSDWQIVNTNPKYLINTFESWFKVNKKFNSSFIVVASYYAGGDLVNSLIRGYEAKGRPSFNLFQSSTKPSMSSMLLNIAKESSVGVSAINSLYSWSLDYANLANNGAVPNLTELDLSIIKAIDKISETGFKSEIGPQIEWTYAVTIPSFEGVFGGVVVSYVDSVGNEHVIESGVDKLVKLTIGWANLKDKNNSDKKVSIILYNYPPGKSDIGASYFDVFQSVHDLLIKLSDEGYNIGMDKKDLPSVEDLTTEIIEFGNKGSWAQGLLNKYVEKNWDTLMANKQLISLDEYYELTKDINPELKKQLINRWHDGLGEIMVYNNTYIVITGMFFGNVLITFQPSRGWEEVENYHDLHLPPHQQYVTFYKWLDKVWKNDVIINMGTHGTLEFLPGRSIGLQSSDWSFELMLNPTIYPYIVSNPGEGMVAKDRLGALMITHMTPAIVSSSLYGNYTVLKNYILRYETAINTNSSTAQALRELIIKKAVSLGFDNITNDEDFDKWAERLHIYLDDMENDINAYGVHTLGHILTGEPLIQEIITIVSSKTKVYNQILHFLYPSLSKLNFFKDVSGNIDYLNESITIRNWFYNFVSEYINGSGSINDLAKKYSIDNTSDLYNSLLCVAQSTLNIRNNQEWFSLLSALNGSYVQTGLFADPSYGDSIPTGKNAYAVDSTKIPSEAAYISAQRIVDMLLVQYYEANNNTWPELLGLILWGTEILRTEGIGICQFLYLLGCDLSWGPTGTVVDVNLLPLKNLTVELSNGKIINRPRIDVYASMVTSNVNWIKLMVKAVNLAFYNTTGEDASVNFLKKHYAENPSLNRLFGLPGAILEGTGVSDLLPNTNKWKNVTNINEVLTGIYLDRVSYAWNLDENGNIVISKEKEQYSYLLSKVDLITQNIDSTWRFLDSDDYYDWFGGMLCAAQNLGAKPTTAIVDIRNKNNYISRTLSEELIFEIRSNIANPYYRDEFLRTDAGASEYSSKIENLWGSVVSSGVTLNKGVYDEVAKAILGGYGSVNSLGKAASWQTMGAWMIYLHDKGYWKGDKKILEDLSNNYIELATKWGVACCHHTCANLDFSKLIIQISTLSNSKKKAFSDVLQEATLCDAIFKYDNTNSNTESNSDSNVPENTNIKGDTTSSNSGYSRDGQASVGADGYEPISHSSADSDSSPSSKTPDKGSQSSDNSKSYEVSKSSSSNSFSSNSGMPVYFVIAVIILIILFSVGYYRGKDND